jgi:hypothetical protein
MQSPRRFIPTVLMVALLGAVQMAGCAGIPVQEMSNARQAVKAAKKAGAEQYAPDVMADAERLLKSATANLNKGEYRAARDQAEQARAKAMEARRLAEIAQSPEPESPPQSPPQS